MTISELKEYIYEQKKIEYVLEQIGCHSVAYHPIKGFYSCANYNGDNKSAINVKNNKYLNVTNWTRPKDFEDNSDIITLVQYNMKMSLIDALKYLHKILDLPFEFKKKEEQKKKFDMLNIFKRQLRSNRRVVDVEDIQVLSDRLIDDYVPMLHIDWVREGITERTRKKFNIAYSYKHKRIVIPHYYWMTNELIAFNMRTTIPNYEEFGIKKYYLSNGYNKSLNLYGYCQNKDEIERKGYCTLVESEKSVLKRYSLGDGTCLALSGKTLSIEQIRIISSLNIREIVICLDNDVDIDEVRWMAEQLKNLRKIKVSYIRDFIGLLGDKDSPCDARNKDYQFLFDNRIVYDKREQELYAKSMKK